ncbi:Ger(x)C family spore germination protein [Paenibacillus sp. CGMCC 1.16610]|uniref:Ger(X)C family spore germination protein n=1 Tax=Paenibacillus anseongense TaxID=2682845 RepID=A0ABW9UKQ2_9BACL|nr:MULTISPECIES: Ger(x)C family spore germination protein [Paenibacillus]MBA2941064.1 Ger(x)C family spore germination protein [Paenibacillus sp. CGMCC 1.16610]MVQ39884.1 Ger(x)C family spore germination protein [Paenibacillus anseongense]
MRRLVCLLLAILPMLLTTSCYGLRQINELAIVTAVGLDVGKEPGSVKLSVQIIRPADARGQTGAPSGGTGEPIYSVSAEGKSIFEAIRNLGHFTSRRVYWAHNFLIVMHESYARRGIADMIDFFTRNHELRMNTWVTVTPDSPSEVISTITGLEVVPGEAVDRLFRNVQIVGLAPASNMMNLEEAYLSRSVEPVVAQVRLVPRGISNKRPEQHGSIKQVDLEGAAAFVNDKMVGWLSPKETKGLMFFLQKLKSGIEVIPCPNNQNKIVTMEFKDIAFKVKPSYSDKLPSFHIRLMIKADVVENNCGAPMTDIREETEEALEAKLNSEIQSVLTKAQQQYHSDFLKLGDVFRNNFPMEWKQLGSNWGAAFSEAQTTVEIKTTIKSTVLKAAEQGVK